MAIGLIIIGDEILSGRRIDKHFPKMLELLSARGLSLSWVEYIGDSPERIIATLKRSLASEDIVFCTGGIGATPDDHTRQCAAAALGVALQLHPEAKHRIEERIGDMAREAGLTPDYDAPENQHRLKMGEFPEGASIIPNAYNKIPGFSLPNVSKVGSHYFVPGFPVMAWQMFEWVLENNYAHLFHRQAWAEKSVLVYGQMESTLTPLMEALEAQFPLIKVFSLPHLGDQQTERHIDLGVKGEPTQVEDAFRKLEQGLQALHAQYR